MREAVEAEPRIARGYFDGFDAQFFASSNYRATVHNIETATILILGSPLLGFLPDHYAAPFMAERRLRAIRPDLFAFTSQIGAILRADAVEAPNVSLLLDALVGWAARRPVPAAGGGTGG